MGKVAVLGVGNLILSDEGLGVRAVELMRERYDFPEEVELIDGGTLGIDLLYYLEGSQKLLILDAILGGGKPGTLYRYEGDEVKAYFRRKVSMHELGIQEVLGLMEVLEKSPEEIVVMGIEPESFEPGTELSESVSRSLPKLIDEALIQLEKWGLGAKERL